MKQVFFIKQPNDHSFNVKPFYHNLHIMNQDTIMTEVLAYTIPSHIYLYPKYPRLSFQHVITILFRNQNITYLKNLID